FHALWCYNIDKTCCGGETCHLDEQNLRCLEDWENLDFQDLVVDGWVDGNGSNPGGGFGKPGAGLETHGGGDGLEWPGGGATWIGVGDSLGDDDEV
ncbi:hypothetical protein Tco_0484264, partial [Tanacetum coccineum]